MIITETVLREIFAQIPDIDYAGRLWPVKFHWGNQDDLNLYMQTEAGNQTPLIWLVQERESHSRLQAERSVRLIIAKSSESKEERNPTVWDSEFESVLNPLLEKVIIGIERSGVTGFVNREFNVYREANYPYNQSAENTKTIDHWNIIEFSANVVFNELGCVRKILFI